MAVVFYFLYKGLKHPITFELPDTPIISPGFTHDNVYLQLKHCFSTADHIDEIIVFTDIHYLTWQLIEPYEILDHPGSTITFSCEHEPYKDAFVMHVHLETISSSIDTITNQFLNGSNPGGIEKTVALFLTNSSKSYSSEIPIKSVMNYFEIINDYENDTRIINLIESLKHNPKWCTQVDSNYFIVGVGRCGSLIQNAKFIEIHCIDNRIKFLKFVRVNNPIITAQNN